MKYLLLILTLLSCSSNHWRDASRDSINLALKPELIKEDTFQIYHARAYSWRGNFAVHPWVAWIKKGQSSYTVAQVTYWKMRSSKTSVSVVQDIPDRKWFDSAPTLMYELKGKKATSAIEKVKGLVSNYPHRETYTLYPGPNSNTFVAYLIRNVDELETELPPNAIGKDYQEIQNIISKSPSGSGFQISLYGILGLTMGLNEGIEVNILGLNFGLDFLRPAIKIPFIGRLGLDKQKRNK